MTLSAPPDRTRPDWPVVIAVMLTALLEVLDLTVVNVSLPHMMGSFGATPDQITWVVTSYMISTAIVMPLTGYLSQRFGRRDVLLFSITGFTLASALCGAAWSLETMTLFRLLQGAFGAVLIPLSQTTLFDAFPRAQRGKAMAIWSVSIMVAPIVGPSLGGYITEHYVWRWVFYINVPLGVVALSMAFGQLPAQPPGTPPRTDWLGLLLMSTTLGCLQAVLDLGHTRDWFASKLITTLAITCMLSGSVFVVRGWRHPHSIVDLHLFRNRNFTLGCIVVAGYCLTMYATIVLLPLLTQRLLGYPADTAGLLFLPRGVVASILMIFIGSYVVNRVDARKLIGLGFLFTAVACYQMSHYTLAVDAWGLIWPGMVQGIGMALIFGQISLVTFDSIPRDRADEAAGLYSVMRTLGSSVGVAVSGTLFVRQEQTHWHTLGGHLRDSNPALHDWLVQAGLDPLAAATPAKLAHLVARHASMQAFTDLYAAITFTFFALLPFVALMRRMRR